MVICIGLVGHVDAGKSTLVKLLANLTYVDRELGGITQDVTCVHLGKNALDQLCGPGVHDVVIIDVPGHTAFVTSRYVSVAVSDITAVVLELGKKVPQDTVQLLNNLDKPYCLIFTKADLYPEKMIQKLKDELLLHGHIVQHYLTPNRVGKPYFLSGFDLKQELLTFLKYCRNATNLAPKFMYLQSIVRRGQTIGTFFSRGITHGEILSAPSVRFERFFTNPYEQFHVTERVKDGVWGAKFTGLLKPGSDLTCAAESARIDGVVVKSSGEGRLNALVSSLEHLGIPVMYSAVGPVTKHDLDCAKTGSFCNQLVVAFETSSFKSEHVLTGRLIHELIAAVAAERINRFRILAKRKLTGHHFTRLKACTNALFYKDSEILIAGYEIITGTVSVGMTFLSSSNKMCVLDMECGGKKIRVGSRGSSVSIRFTAGEHEDMYHTDYLKAFNLYKSELGPQKITLPELAQILSG